MSDAARSDDELFAQGAPQDQAKPAGLPARASQRPQIERADAELDGRLKLLPYYPRVEDIHVACEETPKRAAAGGAPRDWGRMRAAAGLAIVVVIGAAAAAAHIHGLRVASADEAQARSLGHRFEAMSTELESLEANRSHDELANLRKLLAEMKASTASTRDVGGSVSQLAARVDRLEKDQSARLDKLGDRIDHDQAARLTEISARLDKLEAKAPVVAAAASPTPPAKPSAVKTAGVSYEPTGSIERPSPKLRGFFLSAIHNGYAMIESPAGEFAVAPGDVVPGGGRVLRIERHGRDWVVVTTQGQIVAFND